MLFEVHLQLGVAALGDERDDLGERARIGDGTANGLLGRRLVNDLSIAVHCLVGRLPGLAGAALR